MLTAQPALADKAGLSGTGSALGWPAPAAAVAVACFLLVAFGPGLFGCGDTHWHLAAGDWMIAHATVPHADPFSFTFAGQRWVAHEWLAEVVMAAAFAAGSWNALALLFAGLCAATLLVIGGAIGRRLAPGAVLVTLALVTAVLASTALARPHVMGWLLLAIWLDLLLRAREADRAPPPVAALVMLLWANVHSSFLIGLALAGALALEAAAMRARAPVLRGWAAFGALSLAATVLTPHGIDSLLFPIQLSAMRTLPLITEWQPTDFAAQPAFALLLGVGVYVVARRRIAVPLIRGLIVVALLILALEHARHQAIFAIVAPVLLAAPISRERASGEPTGRPAWRLVAGLLACASIAALVRLALPAAEQDSPTDPVAMLDRLPAALKRQPVLNGYDFGGALIHRGIRPFIDGRADMYGDAFMERYARLHGGDRAAFRSAADRYGLTWTILPPTAKLVRTLDSEPGWRRLRADARAVVHVRVAPGGDAARLPRQGP